MNNLSLLNGALEMAMKWRAYHSRGLLYPACGECGVEQGEANLHGMTIEDDGRLMVMFRCRCGATPVIFTKADKEE